MEIVERDAATWVTAIAEGKGTLHVRRARLEVLDGPDAGRGHDTDGRLTRIGGGAIAELRLTDPRVSGLHAELEVTEGGFRLRDLGSRNGTFVGDLRIHDVTLPHGAIVRVGNTRLRFAVRDDAVELPLSADAAFGALVGRTPAMRALFARLAKIAASDLSTLVYGETGTGKDLTAEALHDASPRAGRPFVVIDCGAIPSNLIESALFGHEKGAFTGAASAHAGAFERASGGTVFLDEIGELALEMQPKLLRVLERGTVQRLGGASPIEVDVRVVAATHRDLAREVARGGFREDLYYRLAVATVWMPPLRDRLDDLPLLVDRITRTLTGGRAVTLAPDTLALLARHEWPGNVRELRNVLERVVFLDEAPAGVSELRQGRAVEAAATAAAAVAPAVDLDQPFKQAKEALVREFERDYVTRALARHAGNVSAVARAAGVDRTVIYKIIERHHIK
jgi:DNA-binding NtrC family response regulator